MDGDLHRTLPTEQLLLSAVPAGHALRARTEAFIRARYAEAYGAEVPRFLPLLYALQDREGQILAAAGLGLAADGPLYLEQYLDAPIETVLAQREGRPVARNGVAEIGHLCGLLAGTGRRLFPQIAADLLRRGQHHAVFTATHGLRTLFHRLGIDPAPLAPASPARLDPAAAAAWGRYYAADPWVIGGALELGRHLLGAVGHG
ncbi:MAG: thermostable hemolysin [Xanthomonadales bacterium]|jgi:hypothetical protein|nr:thermostable hemolysin [Xanthomonadales bacterium]